MEHWNGFELKKEIINGREAMIVCPSQGTANGKWTLKTEYFNAFPSVKVELLQRGYHVAHIKNISRWNLPEDTDAKAGLAEFMIQKYNLSLKCVIIGMSCGGMQGIYFASKYPQYVSCMYLDAPVINLLSCPAGLGKGNNDYFEEFKHDTGMSLEDLLSYRNHPLDHFSNLIESNIPVILVCGDSDLLVPYNENGRLLNNIYIKHGKIIETIIKEGAGHHPHALEDNTPIIDFILKYDV